MDLSYSGIDVSKGTLDVQVLPSGDVRSVANTSAGHRELNTFLGGYNIALVVLEATGGYEHAAVVSMVDAGFPVHVAQPQIVHAFAVSMRQRSKNDQIDAHTCARFAQERANDLPVIQKIDKTQEALHALVMRRGQLVKMLTQEKNRGKQVSDKAALKSVKRMKDYLEKEIARVEKEIDSTIKADEVLNAKAKKLRETKGVGPQTVRLLLGLLPELGTVGGKRLNALVGVVPYAQDSGQKKMPRHIAGGRSAVRNGLYMTCMSAAFTNPVMAPFYQGHIKRGHDHKTAIMACIRKLLAHLDKEIAQLMKTMDQAKLAA